MMHTINWVEKNCSEFVYYDDSFQIWKHKTKEEYWAYDEDEEKFVQVRLIARERFSEDQDEFELMEMYENDWCGEVDESYIWVTDDDDANLEVAIFEYAWFKRV